MISPDLDAILRSVFLKARDQRHDLITLEHLLLALLDDAQTRDLFDACAVNMNLLKTDLEDFIKKNAIVVKGELPVDPHPTLGFQRVLQRAVVSLQNTDQKVEVSGPHLIVSLFAEKDSHALYFLTRQGLSRLDVVDYLAHGTRKEAVAADDVFATQAHAPETKKHESVLSQYAEDLNQSAREGKIDPLIGRDTEVQRVMQILCRRRKNNPLLVGEAGVGKTAIAEGLALAVVEGKAPEALKKLHVFSLDMGAMLAGAKYRGDFEKRLKDVIKELEKIPDSLVFIDEIHTVIGAGAASGGALDAANILKPALARGSLRCMGATTYQEYRNVFEKDHALARRFQKVDIEEPSVETTIQILRGLKPKFEAFHHVKYANAAISAAAELSKKYMNDRFLPDKAIDILDEAGAAQRVVAKSRAKKNITKTEIEEVLAKIVRIPPAAVSTDDRSKLASLDRHLKNLIFGQDHAIDQVASAIKLSRSGLGKQDKPIGSFLFSGPTGVGKTELAKQLAFSLGVDLIRFDMSEYMERHAVSRLIGAPPGYVGYEQGGLLTEAILKKPHSVLLLDEVEKAHPDLFNILLQVMDYGSLTDNNGRKADFKNVILIMTTNAGAEQLQRSAIGFTTQKDNSDEMNELKRVFTPEFRNRLDAIVHFKPLASEQISRVVDKFLIELEEQLRLKKVEASFTERLRVWLATKGFDPLMGARPMQRLIQDTIRRALADELLFGRLVNGGEVVIDLDEAQQVKVNVLQIKASDNKTLEPALES